MTIQSKRSFSGARNNRKPLFEVNFSKNSTKTIRLSALNFYEVIVDEADFYDVIADRYLHLRKFCSKVRQYYIKKIVRRPLFCNAKCNNIIVSYI